MAARRQVAAAAAAPAPADLELVDGAFGPSTDPRTPDLVWVPLDPKVAPPPGIPPVHPWPDNPRINARTVARVAISLKRFGWVRPLVANTHPDVYGEIIVGHTARLAGLELGLTQAPVRFRRMEPKEAHAAALADNRLNEFSEWDLEPLGRLALELGAPLFDVAGWDSDAHTRLLNLETGGFLNGSVGAGGAGNTGPGNDRPNTTGLSTLSFTVSLADKTTVLQALALMGREIPASTALVQLCKEKIRAAKRK